MRLLLLALLVATQPIFADSIPAPRFHVSPLGRHVLALTPTEAGGAGVCYELRDDGSLTPRWSVSGWYACRVLLGSDGHTLIRIGGHGEEVRRHPDDLVLLAFYRDGVLKRTFTVVEVEALIGRSLRDVQAGPTYAGESFEGELVGSFIGLDRSEEISWRLIDGSTIRFDLSGMVKVVEVADTKEPKAAEPGATDNPGDAQRLREDH